MLPARFHPAVDAWFGKAFASPTACQSRAWEAIGRHRHVLIAAPTGSGKTLAAFLAIIDDLVREGDAFGLPDQTRVVYVSPLKALSNDIQKNLAQPLDGINRKLFESGSATFALRSQVRTGDTPAAIRAAMLRQPPHILVTTPESLYLLLTGTGGRRLLGNVRTVIVDEIHALAGTKRGAHLALSLERLARLAGQPLTRIGLSATQNPIDEVGRFLTGGAGDCVVIDEGRRRDLDLAIELPDVPLEAVLSQQAAGEIHDRMAELIRQHRTTLVFVNTRRLAERVARALSERLGEDRVTAHHGSLSREQRLGAEDRLKRGQLSALVATGSLELGIDVGQIDLVCQLGSTGSIATLVQRVGRSGHWSGGLPKGRLFPTTRDDLLECVALMRAVRSGELDRMTIQAQPLDVLAQQIVAMTAAEEWSLDELYRCILGAYPYRQLARAEFDAVVQMLVEGYSTRRGARGGHLHRDGVRQRLLPRRSARLTAVTCGGAIPDAAEYRVILEPDGSLLGAVDEHFAIETVRGDVFQLGNTSWRVLGVEGDTLRVADAECQPPTIPFWFGEAPGRTDALSAAVSRLREAFEEHLTTAGMPAAVAWLGEEGGVSACAAEQLGHYLAAARAVLGVLPTAGRIVVERFFDTSGGMQLIVHAPFGSRVNRAWGLALRKRFCRTFNFELQAAANENALILSLGTSQSFPLEDVRHFLKPATVRDVLVQALLDAPMFTVRWRWNAVISLAIRRFHAGRKTPPHLLRMQAEDLVTGVFPDQLACLENIVGDREVPDHPLVRQTIHDCLTEAMDIERLVQVLAGIEAGAIAFECRDVSEPSALAAEIVNARVYSFLDGAPLEERRTRAVVMRRWLDPVTAQDHGVLDPSVVEQVRREVWPDARTSEELHDVLYSSGFLLDSQDIASPWRAFLDELAQQGRVRRHILRSGESLWYAAERARQFAAIYAVEQAAEGSSDDPEEALTAVLQARLGILGPVTEHELVEALALPSARIAAALARLQHQGAVFCGRFTAGVDGFEWCDRVNLGRIHRRSLKAARRSVEPVSPTEYWRFLTRWQHVHPDAKLRGPDALAGLVGQLEGWEAPAAAWEADLLPARMESYEPHWLDQLCQSGRARWLRLRPGQGSAGLPIRSTPIALTGRRHGAYWRQGVAGARLTFSGEATLLTHVLEAHGALFYDELVERSGLTSASAETALGELVAAGLVSSDGFAGLRGLLVPAVQKQRFKGLSWGLESAGRWCLLGDTEAAQAVGVGQDEGLTYLAHKLLQRYGVVFRDMCARETALPPWSDLLPVLRRLEARGEVRGGRFVSSRHGEQFALPEAVDGLHAVRRKSDDVELVISAADPLNLVGILFPGSRIPSSLGRWLVFRRGVPVACGDREGEMRPLGEAASSDATRAGLSGNLPALREEGPKR